MKKIYRISDATPLKNTFKGSLDKKTCFKNFVSVFGVKDLIVIADNCNKNTINFIKKYCNAVKETKLGNSGSLKLAFEIAMTFNNDDIVYLCEDDFLHLPNSEKYLIEGLKETLGSYSTLYDHPDKYSDFGQNPLISQGGESTKIVKSTSIHWKVTNSTVQTFCTYVKTLKEDKNILFKYNFKNKVPKSFETFTELYIRKKYVVSCIPGRCSPCDNFLSPFVNWKAVGENV